MEMRSKEIDSAEVILTPEQEQFLTLVGSVKHIRENFYFTGGTPLAAFYLQHRLSEDIDLFIEQREVYLPAVRAFLKKVEKALRVQKVDYTNFLGLHSFQLYFSETNILKVDFNYYPFPRIEKGMKYKSISVDSVLDIAVNKIHTIAMKPRARDFVDIYFIIKKFGYTFQELLEFDWHIDALQLGSRLFLAKDTKDFPRMIKKIRHEEWQDFFIGEAKKLRPEIIA